MKKELKEIMQEDMEKLPFVNWDRFFEDGWDLEVFGWIDREYNYKDFVSLRYDYDSKLSRQNRKKTWLLDFSTSSAKYSKEITEILTESDEHKDCQRVEEHFEIKNVIKLIRVGGDTKRGKEEKSFREIVSEFETNPKIKEQKIKSKDMEMV